MKPDTDIILIGPMRAGKTTVSFKLADHFDRPVCSVDEVCMYYYLKMGYRKTQHMRIFKEQGHDQSLHYLRSFQTSVAQRVLADFQECIFDFGAGHTHFCDSDQFSCVQRALAPYKNVILLLPFPDQKRSMETLTDRLLQGVPGSKSLYNLYRRTNIRFLKNLLSSASERVRNLDRFVSMNKSFLTGDCYSRLAKWTFYTDGKSPDETCREIVDHLQVK